MRTENNNRSVVYTVGNGSLKSCFSINPTKYLSSLVLLLAKSSQTGSTLFSKLGLTLSKFVLYLLTVPVWNNYLDSIRDIGVLSISYF